MYKRYFYNKKIYILNYILLFLFFYLLNFSSLSSTITEKTIVLYLFNLFIWVFLNNYKLFKFIYSLNMTNKLKLKNIMLIYIKDLRYLSVFIFAFFIDFNQSIFMNVLIVILGSVLSYMIIESIEMQINKYVNFKKFFFDLESIIIYLKLDVLKLDLLKLNNNDNKKNQKELKEKIYKVVNKDTEYIINKDYTLKYRIDFDDKETLTIFIDDKVFTTYVLNVDNPTKL